MRHLCCDDVFGTAYAEEESTISKNQRDLKMKREAAEKIIQAMKKVDDAIGGLDAAVETVENESERQRLRRLLGTLVLDLHEQITLHVVKEFPDLHPDK